MWKFVQLSAFMLIISSQTNLLKLFDTSSILVCWSVYHCQVLYLWVRHLHEVSIILVGSCLFNTINLPPTNALAYYFFYIGSRVFTLKLSTAVINCLSLWDTSTLVQCLKTRLKPTRVEQQGYAPRYAVNIRLGWKLVAVTNTLAYDASELITTVKSFEVSPFRETGNSLKVILFSIEKLQLHWNKLSAAVSGLPCDHRKMLWNFFCPNATCGQCD
jgi:hypothetical protein